MFYALHRTIKWLVYGALAFVGLQLYDHRAAFEPAVIWYHVWDNGGFDVQPPRVIAGRVTRIYNSQTFLLRPRQGIYLNVRLMGLKDPPGPRTLDGQKKEKLRHKALEDLILDKWVHVELSYENANNIGGIVFCRGTNINAHLVQQRLAFLKPEEIKSFPKETQYALLWSERHRLQPQENANP